MNPIDTLLELFPNKFNKYYAVKTDWGISLKTIELLYYLPMALILFGILYYFVMWERFGWKKKFKLRFNIYIFLLTGFISFLIVFAIAAFKSHDITQLDINLNQKKIIIHRLFTKKEISFDSLKEFEKLTLEIRIHENSNSSKEYFLHHLLIGKQEIISFNYGEFNNVKSDEYVEFKVFVEKFERAILHLVDY